MVNQKVNHLVKLMQRAVKYTGNVDIYCIKNLFKICEVCVQCACASFLNVMLKKLLNKNQRYCKVKCGLFFWNIVYMVVALRQRVL